MTPSAEGLSAANVRAGNLRPLVGFDRFPRRAELWARRVPAREAPPTVFVVDDDAAAREPLAVLLRTRGWRCEAFPSAAAFLHRSTGADAGCIVLEANLPGMSGLDLQGRLASSGALTPIIFVTGRAEVPTVVRAMKAGAFEFLSKPVDPDHILRSVERAIERDSESRRRLAELQTLRERQAKLTNREREVMDLIVAGRMNKQIAFELSISEVTVKVHRGRVMAKMCARSLAELVRFSIGLTASDYARAAA